MRATEQVRSENRVSKRECIVSGDHGLSGPRRSLKDEGDRRWYVGEKEEEIEKEAFYSAMAIRSEWPILPVVL